MTDPVVYGALAVALMSATIGLTVSLLVMRRVWNGQRPRPAIFVLLVSLFGMSLGQLVEQSRVAVFRLSYDRHIDGSYFGSLYDSPWNVSSAKIRFALSLAAAAAVKLGLYCDKSDETVLRWAAMAAAGTFLSWAMMTFAIDLFI